MTAPIRLLMAPYYQLVRSEGVGVAIDDDPAGLAVVDYPVDSGFIAGGGAISFFWTGTNVAPGESLDFQVLELVGLTGSEQWVITAEFFEVPPSRACFVPGSYQGQMYIKIPTSGTHVAAGTALQMRAAARGQG